jgi:hypothetical protein
MKLTFDELMQRHGKYTDAERLLVQAIAALSTREGFSNMTPWEVFDTVKQQAEEVDADALRIELAARE